MPDSRVIRIDPETIDSVSLSYLTYGRVSQESIDELREAIPDALNLQEVNDVGIQIATKVEIQRPSYDGYSRGKRAEKDAILQLGIASLYYGDLVTAESAKAYLRRNMKDYVSAFVLSRMIKRKKNAIIDNIMSG